jgi:integrase
VDDALLHLDESSRVLLRPTLQPGVYCLLVSIVIGEASRRDECAAAQIPSDLFWNLEGGLVIGILVELLDISLYVFTGFLANRFRTAMSRACTAAGVPSFSPHDFRHRRVSLMHLGGAPWARIGEHVGHDDLVTTARTYTHVLADEREIDYEEVLT